MDVRKYWAERRKKNRGDARRVPSTTLFETLEARRLLHAAATTGLSGPLSPKANDPVDISNQVNVPNNSTDAQVAVDPSNAQFMCAAWTANSLIYTAYSVNGGTTWTKSNNNSSAFTKPGSELGNDDAHIAYDAQGDIFLVSDFGVRNTDDVSAVQLSVSRPPGPNQAAGASFSSVAEITAPTAGDITDQPTVAIGPGTGAQSIWIAFKEAKPNTGFKAQWDPDTQAHIYYDTLPVTSALGQSATLPPPVALTLPTAVRPVSNVQYTIQPELPDVAVAPDGTVAITFEEDTQTEDRVDTNLRVGVANPLSTSELFVARKANGAGSSFGAPVPIGTSKLTSNQPQTGGLGGIEVDPLLSVAFDTSTSAQRGWLYATYVTKDANNNTVVALDASPTGAGWQNLFVFSRATGSPDFEELDPALAVDRWTGYVGVTWYGLTGDGFSRMAALSDDGGKHFSLLKVSGSTRSSLGANYGSWAGVAMNGQSLEAIWSGGSKVGPNHIITATVPIAGTPQQRIIIEPGDGEGAAGLAASLDGGEVLSLGDDNSNDTIYARTTDNGGEFLEFYDTPDMTDAPIFIATTSAVAEIELDANPDESDPQVLDAAAIEADADGYQAPVNINFEGDDKITGIPNYLDDEGPYVAWRGYTEADNPVSGQIAIGAPGTGDVLEAPGSATLGGDLRVVSTVNSADPTVYPKGTSFTILTASSISGVFDNLPVSGDYADSGGDANGRGLTLPPLGYDPTTNNAYGYPDQLVWQVSYATTALVLTVVDAPQGWNYAEVSAGGSGLTYPTEGETVSGVVGGLALPYYTGSLAGLSATIGWGDGTVSTGTIDPETLQISGSHTYIQASPWDGWDMTLTVTGGVLGANVLVDHAPIEVSPATLTPIDVSPVTGMLGQTFDGTIAKFSDANPLAPVCDFIAEVDWGDSNVGYVAAQVVSEGNGIFDVVGSHSWLQTGDLSVTAALIYPVVDNFPGSSTTSAFIDAPIGGGGIGDGSGTVSTVNGTAGQPVTCVATYVDDDPSLGSGDFAASVDWGDGTQPEDVSVNSLGDGVYAVDAGYAYHEAGTYTVTVSLSHVGLSGSTISDSESAQAIIADAPLTPNGEDVDASVGQTYSGSAGSFTDANPYAVASQFAATVDWGDGGGAIPATVVADSAGGFDVVGSHAYAQAGNDDIVVTVTDVGGTTTSIFSTAAIAPTITGGTIGAVLGQAYTGAVAGFTDGNPSSVPGDFTATIDWGDGQTSNGLVQAGATAGTFVVLDGDGTHSYSAAGTYNVAVTVNSSIEPGATGIINATAYQPIVPVNGGFSTDGNPQDTVTSGNGPDVYYTASFTDADTSLTAADLQGTINWGDGQTTTSTVTFVNGEICVTGEHAYGSPGDYGVIATLSQPLPQGQVIAATVEAGIVLTGTGWSVDTMTFDAIAGQNYTGPVAQLVTDPIWGVPQGLMVSIESNGGSTTGSVVADPNNPGSYIVVSNSGLSLLPGWQSIYVYANDANGYYCSASSIAVVTPAAPTDVFGGTDSDQALTITWADDVNGGNTTYNIYRGTSADFTPSQANLIATNVSGGEDTDSGTLTSGTTYYYLATAVNSSLESAPGVITEATTSAANLQVEGATLSAEVTQPLDSGTVLASFTDDNTSDPAGAFTATIDWGDGQTSAGLVQAVAGQPGSFIITEDTSGGSGHAYAAEGYYTATITINGAGGGENSASETVDVGVYIPPRGGLG